MRTELPLNAINVLIGLALLLIGVVLNLLNGVLKRTQSQQLARLWKDRTLWPDDIGPSSSDEGRGRPIRGGSDSRPEPDQLTLRIRVALVACPGPAALSHWGDVGWAGNREALCHLCPGDRRDRDRIRGRQRCRSALLPSAVLRTLV
jgi:hypothetical protein